MPENEVDQMTRETAALGHAAASVISTWRQQHPGKTRIPRHVRKQALRRWRIEMNNERMRLLEERRRLRAEIADQITWHRRNALDVHLRFANQPDILSHEHHELRKDRWHLEQQIAYTPHLSATERGQAISALVSAHYATNPHEPARPVWGGKLSGLAALRARLADRLSRQQLGITDRGPGITDRGRGRPAPPSRLTQARPTTPAAPTQLHTYWTTPQPVSPPAPQPQQRGVDRADIERIEARQRHLAEEIAKAHRAIAERDALQAKVQDLGARYTDTQRQYRRVAEDLAARGRELSDVHEELGKVRAERDELRRRLEITDTRTNPARKTTPDAPDAPDTPEGPKVPERGGRKPAARTRISRKPNTPQAPQTPTASRAGKAGGRAKTAKAPKVPAVAAAAVGGRRNGAPQVSDYPPPPDAPSVPEEPSVPDWQWEGFDR